MGTDKGLLTTGNTPWAIRMGDKLGPWGIPVVYSVNGRQAAAYSAIISAHQLVIDAIGLSGPMEGLLTVHAGYPARDLLLLACDMQDLDARTLAHLIKSYLADEEGQATGYAYRDGAGLQPFGAIYTVRLLRAAYELAKAARLSDRRLRSLLEGDGTKILQPVDEGAFRNYNTLQ